MDESEPKIELPRHEYDDDSCCIRCGFDGAEWWHLERMKPKQDREREPACTAQRRRSE
jgi:hypothetical protein